MVLSSGDDLDAVLTERHSYLRALIEQPRSKRELEDAVDFSRSTLIGLSATSLLLTSPGTKTASGHPRCSGGVAIERRKRIGTDSPHSPKQPPPRTPLARRPAWLCVP